MLSSIIAPGKVLLHMGCDDCGRGEAYLAVKVLKKLGVKTEVRDFDCGCDFYGSDEARIKELVGENKRLLDDYQKVIVGCGRCYHVMKTYYPGKTKHISVLILEKLRGMDHKFSGHGDVLYHDPCFLSRHHHIVDSPREILTKLGYTVREFKNNKERSDCCGDYSPVQALRERPAEIRMGQAPKGALLTAACPKCTTNFSDFNNPNSKITVRPFLELVDQALNMEIPAKL